MARFVTFRRALPRAGSSSAAHLLLAVLGAVTVAVLALAPVAHAENRLVSSDPAEGSSVQTSPTSITLTFAEQVGSRNTVVASCNGTQVPIGNPAVSPDRLTLTSAVVNPFPRGSCNVTYLVTAPDGSPNGSASFEFTVLEDPPPGAVTTVPPTAAATAPATGAGATDPGGTASTAPPITAAPTGTGDAAAEEADDVDGPLGLGRLVGSLGLAALLGSLVLIAVGWPEGIEYVLTVRFLRTSWFVALVGTVLTTVALTSQATGRSFGASLNPTTWTDLTDSTPGIAALARLVFTAASAWTIIRPERCVDQTTQLPALALPIIAVATYGFSRTGGDLAAIGTVAGVGHAIAMSLWLGGLLLLTRVVLAGPGEEDLVHAVRGYHRVSGPALAITVVTGAVQVYRLDRGTLFETGHGRAVVVKGLVVGAMVFIGLMTRQYASTTLRRTDVMTAPLAAKLRRATGFEALGGVVVLALSAWLLTLTPGAVDRARADEVVYGSTTSIISGDLDVSISITGRVGENGVRVEVNQPATGLSSLVLRFIPPEGTGAPQVDLTVPAELSGAGVAVLPESEGIPLLVAGTWTLRVDSVTPAGAVSVTRSFFLDT